MKYCTLIPIKDPKAMHIGGVKSGVCGVYTTLHTEYSYSCWRCRRLMYSVYRAPHPSRGKAIYLSLLPCGFSGSPPVSPWRQLC